MWVNRSSTVSKLHLIGTMNKLHNILLLPLLIVLLALPQGNLTAQNQTKEVVCTIPTITELARQVSGEGQFKFTTLAPPNRDPHTIEARPSLMKKVGEADLFLRIGMQLEPWAEQVADGSGNPRIFPGAEAHHTLSGPIPKLEVPQVASRDAGHIHPQGNPHFWLDPVRTKILAAEIAKSLKSIASGDGAQIIDDRLKQFRQKINQNLYGEELLTLVGENKLDRLAIDGKLWTFLQENEFQGESLAAKAGPWLKKARPLQGQSVVEYHQAWIYFFRTFGMQKVGTVEEKPGIPPGPQHIRKTKQLIQDKDVKLVLVDNFYDASSSKTVARETSASVVILPSQVGGAEGTDDYFSFMEYLLDQMVNKLNDGAE